MELKKINENTYEIPKTGKMKVPAIIYASKALMEKIQLDNTLKQAQNVAHLEGIQKAAYTMPDAHQGYGFRSEERRVGKECRSRWSPYH